MCGSSETRPPPTPVAVTLAPIDILFARSTMLSAAKRPPGTKAAVVMSGEVVMLPVLLLPESSNSSPLALPAGMVIGLSISKLPLVLKVSLLARPPLYSLNTWMSPVRDGEPIMSHWASTVASQAGSSCSALVSRATLKSRYLDEVQVLKDTVGRTAPEAPIVPISPMLSATMSIVPLERSDQALPSTKEPPVLLKIMAPVPVSAPPPAPPKVMLFPVTVRWPVPAATLPSKLTRLPPLIVILPLPLISGPSRSTWVASMFTLPPPVSMLAPAATWMAPLPVAYDG